MSSRSIAWTLTFALLGCGSSRGSDLFGGQGSTGCGSGLSQCSADSGAGGTSSAGGTTSATGGTGATGSGGATTPLGAGGFAGSGGVVTTGSGGATTPMDAGRPDTGRVVECPVRGFSGTASGSGYKSQIGSISVTATLVFTVVASGAIQGTYTGKTPTASTATLSGQMDCRTNTVTMAVQAGSYNGVFPFTAGGTFTGTMSATYDPAAASFSGTWKITENNPAYGGEGSWTAN